MDFKNNTLHNFGLSFIIIILTALLFEVLINNKADFLVFLIRIILILIALIFAFLIFYDLQKNFLDHRNEMKKIKEIYEKELLRKDQEIERINKEAEIIMKSALKQSDKARLLSESLNKLKSQKNRKNG